MLPVHSAARCSCIGVVRLKFVLHPVQLFKVRGGKEGSGGGCKWEGGVPLNLNEFCAW